MPITAYDDQTSEFAILPGTAATYHAIDGEGLAGDNAAAMAIGAFSTGVWAPAAKTITLAAQFTNYLAYLTAVGVAPNAIAGDRIIITAGTGVIPGTYHIASATSGVLTLLEDIVGGSGATPADVTGSSGAPTLRQTRNALWLGRTAPAAGKVCDMQLLSIIPMTSPAATDGVKITDSAGNAIKGLSFTARVASSLVPLVDAVDAPIYVRPVSANEPICFTVVGTASWMVRYRRIPLTGVQ